MQGRYVGMTCPSIQNETGIRGDDLRRFVQAAVKVKAGQGLVVSVDFKVSRNYQSRGWCYVEDGHIEIQVGRGFSGQPWEIKELGALLEHEIDHCFGLEHAEMPVWWELEAAWTCGRQLRLRKGQQPHRLEVEIRALTDKLHSGA